MSEHVLCMVLYLIELGLDNQVQDTKEEEVSFGTTTKRVKNLKSVIEHIALIYKARREGNIVT